MHEFYMYMCWWGFTKILFSSRVTVSVVTIKGEECRVMELGQVADATGGDVSLYFSTPVLIL